MIRVRRIGLAIVVLIFTLFVINSQTSPIRADPAPFQIGDMFAGINNGLVEHYDATGNLVTRMAK